MIEYGNVALIFYEDDFIFEFNSLSKENCKQGKKGFC